MKCLKLNWNFHRGGGGVGVLVTIRMMDIAGCKWEAVVNDLLHVEVGCDVFFPGWLHVL